MKFITHLRLHFQATRLQGIIVRHIQLSAQVSHPLWMMVPIKGTLDMLNKPIIIPIRYISLRFIIERFSVGPFPVHSPLLWESWLVSFPPLNDMLKFSGYSRLSSGCIIQELNVLYICNDVCIFSLVFIVIIITEQHTSTIDD